MKNFVFDIGNVLATFNGRAFCRHYLDGEGARRVYDSLFPDLWNQYDQGLISEDQIVSQVSQQYPQYRKQIETMMKEWPVLLKICWENVRFVSELPEDCYILSNIPEAAEQALRNQGMLEFFKGGLYSWREKLIKPDPEIFIRFLNQNHLSAGECVFIDDRADNVQAASSLGFRAVQLKNIQDLKDVIEKLISEEKDQDQKAAVRKPDLPEPVEIHHS